MSPIYWVGSPKYTAGHPAPLIALVHHRMVGTLRSTDAAFTSTDGPHGRSMSSPRSSPLGARLRMRLRASASAPSTAKRHLADLRARSGLTTEQLIYGGARRGGSWCRVWSLAELAAP